MPSSFSSIVERYKEQVIAIGELSKNLTPELDRLRKEPPFQKRVLQSIELFDREKQKVAISAVVATIDIWEALTTADPEEVKRVVDQADAIDDRLSFEFDGSELSIGGTDRDLRRSVMDTFDGLQSRLIRPSHKTLLRRSLLAMLVGTFESYIGDLYRKNLELHPGIINSSEKSFSLKEIQAFSSIDEAQQTLIDREVDQFTRKGFDDWGEWLSKPPIELDRKLKSSDWAAAREIYERRNLVLHRSCRVSSQYLSKVSTEFSRELSVGDRLDVDEEYLDNALDLLLKLGLTLGLRMWSRLASNDDELGQWATAAQVEFLDAKNPSVTQAISDALDHNRLKASAQLQVRVNSWLAEKELHGVESIRGEVRAWDTGPLSPLYQVAQAALLDDLSHAEAGVRALIKEEKLSIVDALQWPLFASLRESGAIDDLLYPDENRAVSPDERDSRVTLSREAPDNSPVDALEGESGDAEEPMP
ncbi:hypothetical protein [Dietzia lutea]|uniref:hypothetical protein n=1 Tax=Dietzia lutea TaxID=546160 RepID=UPI00133009D5|nr:hypothetical protein [Dietzia lutea]